MTFWFDVIVAGTAAVAFASLLVPRLGRRRRVHRWVAAAVACIGLAAAAAAAGQVSGPQPTAAWSLLTTVLGLAGAVLAVVSLVVSMMERSGAPPS
jgi:peptidoglycan/LPS O-acetylase OafA/YrhL